MSRRLFKAIEPRPPSREPSAKHPVLPVSHELGAAEFARPHTHVWGQVSYALSGVFKVTVPGSSWIVPPLRAIWIAPGVEHEITVLEKASLRPLCIHAAQAPFPGEQCRVLEVSPLLRELIVAIGHCGEGPRESMLAGLILNELASAETQAIRVPAPSDKRLKALCDLLLREPGAPFTLADWARQVGASERTLARLFERDLGLRFGQWRQQVRLAHALPLMARGMPLSQVAQELGYASQSAFSAMFKKTLGSSPKALRTGSSAV